MKYLVAKDSDISSCNIYYRSPCKGSFQWIAGEILLVKGDRVSPKLLIGNKRTSKVRRKCSTKCVNCLLIKANNKIILNISE